MTPEQIRAELQRRNMTIRDLAEAVGMEENKLSKSLAQTGVPRRFAVEEMDAIRKELAPEDGREPLRRIPLLGSVPAGKPQPASEHRGRWFAVNDPDTPAYAYALTVDGDSMDLYVPDGATLTIDPTDVKLWPGECYIIRTEDGESTFKEFQADPARLIPCSTNPANREIAIGDEPIQVLGKVYAFTTRMRPRRVSVDRPR